MNPPTPGRSDSTRWLLPAWATLLVALVGDAGPIGRCVALAGGAIAFAAFAKLARIRPTRHVAIAVTVAALVAPAVIWLVQFTLLHALVPIESPILGTCRNLALALAAGGVARHALWSRGIGLATCVVAALYVDERLHVPAYVGTMLVASASFGTFGDAPLAARIGACAAIVAACLTAAWLIGEVPHAGGRTGFVPASGGTGAGSDRATLGVGDGPDVVNATGDAQSIGFDQSDVFVNSEHAGLYDAFIESFGEPITSTDVKKMIGLKRDQISTSKQRAELDLRRGKTFALRRSPPPAPSVHDAAGADVALWIDSDQSQHLPLRVYDHFDGTSWQEVTQTTMKASLQNVDDSRWMVRVDRPYSAAIGETTATTIVTGTYADPIVPMPALSTAFKLGRVDRTDFFLAAAPSFVRLRDRPVPAGTAIEVTHCLLLADALQTMTTPARRDLRRPGLADAVGPRVDAFANRVAGGRTVGWPQVNATLAELRAIARFDRKAATTTDAPLDEFLGRGVGGSYHFASTFAVVLDRLGYDVRVVSGFYADTRQRDARSGQIIVRPSDAHLWCELRLSDGTWIPIDPTPGFDVAVVRPSRLARWWAMTSTWLVVHRVAIAVGGVLLGIVAIRWRRAADVALTLAWRLTPAPSSRIRRAAVLLDRRAWLAGAPRPASQPFARWLGDRSPATPNVAAFGDALDRELYADATASSESCDVATVAVATMSFSTFRRPMPVPPGVQRCH